MKKKMTEKREESQVLVLDLTEKNNKLLDGNFFKRIYLNRTSFFEEYSKISRKGTEII